MSVDYCLLLLPPRRQGARRGGEARLPTDVCKQKQSFCTSLCPAVRQQKPLSSPRFDALKADFPTCTFQCRSVFSQTPVSGCSPIQTPGPDSLQRRLRSRWGFIGWSNNHFNNLHFTNLLEQKICSRHVCEFLKRRSYSSTRT